ncbi:hypothetical protein [Escherichia coli]|uniref:hypothetical protein n=1 Tax=Escherichia coli TaxID=562 RepID=UPI001E4C355B|nr:hypothetical protein [Escherichia coli]
MDKTRKYDRALQLEILNTLIDCAPHSLNKAQERDLIENLTVTITLWRACYTLKCMVSFLLPSYAAIPWLALILSSMPRTATLQRKELIFFSMMAA